MLLLVVKLSETFSGRTAEPGNFRTAPAPNLMPHRSISSRGENGQVLVALTLAPHHCSQDTVNNISQKQTGETVRSSSRDNLKHSYPRSEMVCSVFPRPISSARIPLMPFSYRPIIQFRPRICRHTNSNQSCTSQISTLHLANNNF